MVGCSKKPGKSGLHAMFAPEKRSRVPQPLVFRPFRLVCDPGHRRGPCLFARFSSTNYVAYLGDSEKQPFRASEQDFVKSKQPDTGAAHAPKTARGRRPFGLLILTHARQ